LAVLYGIFVAYQLWWTSDDAFISFQYARNLNRGLGLVYNAGERVEGETNFLWTIWIALGSRFGAKAETWANMWGIACYGATIAVLAALALRDAAAR
jgi:hypothetical protein